MPLGRARAIVWPSPRAGRRCRSRCGRRGCDRGDPVLTNGFTLAPVPGAIAAVGGASVLVEITDDLVIDLDDLAAKAKPAARAFCCCRTCAAICATWTALMQI